MDRVLVTTINPWLFNGRDELLSAFFSSLRSALGKSRSEKLSAAISALDRYQDAVGVAAQIAAAYTDLHGTGGKASALVKQARQNLKALIKKQRELSPAEERASLEKKIAVSRQAIVVLVDELEDQNRRAIDQILEVATHARDLTELAAQVVNAAIASYSAA